MQHVTKNLPKLHFKLMIYDKFLSEQTKTTRVQKEVNI